MPASTPQQVRERRLAVEERVIAQILVIELGSNARLITNVANGQHEESSFVRGRDADKNRLHQRTDRSRKVHVEQRPPGAAAVIGADAGR